MKSTKVNKYQMKKNQIRQQAIDYQNSFCEGKTYYYSDLVEKTEYFKKYGKRYGLLEEFKENGII